jgi:putative NADPH-quinone reductase
LQAQLLDQFGGLTFFPQPNQGFWTLAGITYRDEIVIYRVITSDQQEARRFLADLKERLREEFEQEEILIVERDVETL